MYGETPMDDTRPEETIARQKKALRAEMQRRLDLLSAHEAALSGRKIAETILASRWYREADSLFIYVSVGKEPDTMPVLRQALSDGKAVYVPKCRKKPQMDAVRLYSLSLLRPGMLNIPEPENDGPGAGAVDLALVPCLSVSPDGTRLGHGGGYYDCWLRAHPCRTVCLCHQALVSDALPAAPWDVRMDAWTAGEEIRLCGNT